MKETLCYQLYETINSTKMIKLFVENVDTGEKQRVEDYIISFNYKNDISYLNLSKSNVKDCYDEQGNFLNFEYEPIIDLEIADNEIKEVEISKYRILIKTKLFIIAFTEKI